ncbi:MAG: hypothetical protein AAB524_02450 [Patescibacteria group bacterium]
MPEKIKSQFAFKSEETKQLLEKMVVEKRQAVFQRFPLLFTLLGAFGLVATLHGFEGLMDRIGLSGNPLLLLVLGIGILIFTGTLYKKLDG